MGIEEWLGSTAISPPVALVLVVLNHRDSILHFFVLGHVGMWCHVYTGNPWDVSQHYELLWLAIGRHIFWTIQDIRSIIKDVWYKVVLKDEVHTSILSLKEHAKFCCSKPFWSQCWTKHLLPNANASFGPDLQQLQGTLHNFCLCCSVECVCVDLDLGFAVKLENGQNM